MSFLSWCHTAGESGLSKAAVQRYRRVRTKLRVLCRRPSKYIWQRSQLASEMADNRLIDPVIASAIAAVRAPAGAESVLAIG